MAEEVGAKAREGGALWAVDREASTAGFSVRFLTVGKTSGLFGEVAGTIAFDEEHPSAASVEAIIEVPSVDTGNEARDEHIQEREDFFEAGKFPEMRFRGTRVEPADGGRPACHLRRRDGDKPQGLRARLERYGWPSHDRGSGLREDTSGSRGAVPSVS